MPLVACVCLKQEADEADEADATCRRRAIGRSRNSGIHGITRAKGLLWQ